MSTQTNAVPLAPSSVLCLISSKFVDSIPDLSDFLQLKTLNIVSFDFLSNINGPRDFTPLVTALSTVTPSSALCTIIFTRIPWAPSWRMDAEGWSALDAVLVNLAQSHPKLRVTFSFNTQLPPCPRSAKSLVLETALKEHLPSFLAQNGYAEVTMTQRPDVIYGHRVIKL